MIEVIEAKIEIQKYFCQKYDFKGTQLVKELRREKEIERVKVQKAFLFLKS